MTKHKLPRCRVCGGKGWQWYRRRGRDKQPGDYAWGYCSSCHGFGVSLVDVAHAAGIARKPRPFGPGGEP